MTTLRQHQQHAARVQATRPLTEAQIAARRVTAAKARAARTANAAARRAAKPGKDTP